jgi:hypothetical protein
MVLGSVISLTGAFLSKDIPSGVDADMPLHCHSGSWCDPFKSWQFSYTFNPTANLTEAEAKFVLGGKYTKIRFLLKPPRLNHTLFRPAPPVD